MSDTQAQSMPLAKTRGRPRKADTTAYEMPVAELVANINRTSKSHRLAEERFEDESVVADDLVAIPQEQHPDVQTFQTFQRAEVRALLNCLPRRERTVIERHFGINRPQEAAETLAEIGASFQVTAEYIRIIESKALARLRALKAQDIELITGRNIPPELLPLQPELLPSPPETVLNSDAAVRRNKSTRDLLKGIPVALLAERLHKRLKQRNKRLVPIEILVQRLESRELTRANLTTFCLSWGLLGSRPRPDEAIGNMLAADRTVIGRRRRLAEEIVLPELFECEHSAQSAVLKRSHINAQYYRLRHRMPAKETCDERP
jgi:Sigma-70, region 4